VSGTHASRAREPDVAAFAVRGGVRIGYEVFDGPHGDADPTVLLMP
jgi:hypothetical protein